MKKGLILAAVVFISKMSFAQAPFPTPEEVEGLTQTKTLVVLEDDLFSGFNINVKDAMKKYWSLTSYDFISTSEFDEMRTDPSYSFLVLTQTRFDRDKRAVYYNFLNFLLGKDVRKIEEMPELCSFPLSYSEVDEEKFDYKLGVIIRFMQEHARLILKDPTVTALQYLNYYNENTPEVIHRTILVAADDLAEEVNTPEKIKAVYPYPVEIVSHQEIEAALSEQRPNTVILHKVGPEDTSLTGRTYKVLIGCDDARVYYFNYHTVSKKTPDGFLERDFKRIGRY